MFLYKVASLPQNLCQLSTKTVIHHNSSESSSSTGDKLDDYAKARYKSNGLLTIMKLTSPGGGMNPDMSLVDFVQDGDLNKSLKHFVSKIQSFFTEMN